MILPGLKIDISIPRYLIFSASILALADAYPSSSPGISEYDGKSLTDEIHANPRTSRTDGDDVDNDGFSKVTKDMLDIPDVSDINSDSHLIDDSTNHLHSHVPFHELNPGALLVTKNIKADEKTADGSDSGVVTISYKPSWWYRAKEVQVILDTFPNPSSYSSSSSSSSSSPPMSLLGQSERTTINDDVLYSEIEDASSRESTNPQQHAPNKSKISSKSNHNRKSNGFRRTNNQPETMKSGPDSNSYQYGSALIDPPSRIRQAEIVDGPDGAVCYFAAILPEKNDFGLLKIPLTGDDAIDFSKDEISSLYMGAVECVLADEEKEDGEELVGEEVEGKNKDEEVPEEILS